MRLFSVMRPLAFAAAVLMAVPAVSAAEETGKEIVEKFIAATGGKEKYAGIKTQVTKATMTIKEAGLNGELTIYQAGLGKLYAEITLPGLGLTKRGVTGEVAWDMSDFQGPRLVEGTEAAAMIEESDLQAAADLTKYYTSIELTGSKTFDGEECHEVTFKKKQGEPEKRYYSKKTNLMVASASTQDSQIGKVEIETRVSDYREVEGLKMPFKITQKMQGITQELVIKSVEINTSIDDAKFAIPEEVKALMKK